MLDDVEAVLSRTAENVRADVVAGFSRCGSARLVG